MRIREHAYRIGDKVLQLVNNPEQNVFNGDIGIIVSMETVKDQKSPTKITIDFDETEVTYEKKVSGVNSLWLIVRRFIRLRVVNSKW